MKRKTLKTFVAIFIILILASIVAAIDFVPRGDINGRGIYDIKNFLWVNASDATFSNNITANYFIGDGSQLTGLTNVTTASVNHSNSSDYWDDLNTPSDITSLGSIVHSGNVNLSSNNITNVSDLFVTNIHGGSPVNFLNNIAMAAYNITANYINGNGSLLTGISSAWADITGKPTVLSNFTDDVGYIDNSSNQHIEGTKYFDDQLKIPTNAGVPSGTNYEGELVWDSSGDDLYSGKGGSSWQKIGGNITQAAISSSTLKAGLISEIPTYSKISYDFSSDESNVSTNFSYCDVSNEYKIKSENTGELRMQEFYLNLSIRPSSDLDITEGIVHWDTYAATIVDETDDSSVNHSVFGGGNYLNCAGASYAETEDTEKYTLSCDGGGQVQLTTYINGTEAPSLSQDNTSIYILSTHTKLRYLGSGRRVKFFIRNTTSSQVLSDKTYTSAEGSDLFVLKVNSVGNIDLWRNEIYEGTKVITLKGDTYLYIDLYGNIGYDGWLDIYNYRQIKGSETSSLTEGFSCDTSGSYTTIDSSGSATCSSTGISSNSRLTGTPTAGEVFVSRRLDYLHFTSSD